MLTKDTELTFQVAFSMLKGASYDVWLALQERGISLSDFFEADDMALRNAAGGDKMRLPDRYARDEAMVRARRELEFTSKHNIRPLWVEGDDYPWRMVNVANPPLVIYMLGQCNLNVEHVASVVGTRKLTPCGAEFTRRFIGDLAGYFPDLVVVSGLAYGTDAVAHQAALDAGVPTVGVLAHGLDMMYPASHRDLAKRMLAAGGGLISQYPSGTRIYRNNFLERNRIVATLSDATVVIESEIKGGAMSTARHAFEADRDVYAVPGRVSDPMSAGCNHLIRKQRASLLTAAADLIERTGWTPLGAHINPDQRSLFPELGGEPKVIYDYLRFEPEPRGADQIHLHTGLPMGRLLSLLADMEFDGVLIRHPGNRFSVAL